MAPKTAKRKTPPAAVVRAQEYESSGFFAGDIGHALIKGSSDDAYASFPHALVEISSREWASLKERGGLTEDFYEVNGQYWAVGETAERHGWQGRREGASRYTKGYSGVLMAVAMSRVFRQSMRDVTVIATHAPEFKDYRPDIREATKGAWIVNGHEGNLRFNINQVALADEPVAGAYNYILNDRADGARYGIDETGDGLVIDIGGFTVDMTVLVNGVPDYLSTRSIPGRGIQYAVEALQSALRAKYAKELKSVSRISQDKVRDALKRGHFSAGGYGDLDVQTEASYARAQIVSEVKELFDRFGGVAALDYILLTGGGSGLLMDEIKQALGHGRIYLAGDPRHIHLANAYGALKYLHLAARNGKVKVKPAR